MGMTGLLDTHALVWAITEPDRLGPGARRFISEPTNVILASAASAWELATKVRIGKFREAEPIVAQYDQLLDRLGAVQLPITHEHALRAGQIPWSHRDPFDRMFAAQTMMENVTLISRDVAFVELIAVPTIW